jgi:Icc-related predicted phosphoesterase
MTMGKETTMRMLLFSDLHGQTGLAAELVRLSADVDLVIGAGDFGNVRRGTRECLQLLRAISVPAVIVPGNAESYEELVEAAEVWPSARVLHGSEITINGVSFFGVGGAVPITPFGDWSYDFTESQAAKMLECCPQHGVLVTHAPPYGVADIDGSGRSRGSHAIRDAILARGLALAVCGHIHASAGTQLQLGATTFINAGPIGLIFELDTPSGNR